VHGVVAGRVYSERNIFSALEALIFFILLAGVVFGLEAGKPERRL